MRKRIIIILVAMMAGLSCYAQTTQQADSLHQRGKELVNEGKIVEGRECTRQAMEMRKVLLGEVSEDYITSLSNFALTFAMTEEYAKAVELQEQVMALCGKLKEPHKNLGMYSTNMGRFYYLVGDKEKAARMWEQALPLVEKHGEIYEFLLNGLGAVYDDLGDRQGMSRIMGLMEEHNRHELTKPCDEPKCMLERAQYYGATGNHAEAKECYLKALEMSVSMDDETKIKAHEAYAQFMAMTMKDRRTGAEHQHTAANLRKDQFGENEEYADAIYKAGIFYSFEMNSEGWRTAIECYEKAVVVYRQQGNKAKMAKCNQMMGNAYSGLKDYAQAKDHYLEAMAYYEENDQDNEDYPKIIERVASAEKFNREYDASIVHYQQAMNLFLQRGMMQEYSNAESGLRMCYIYAGRPIDEASDGTGDEAVKAAQRARLDHIIDEEKASLELTRDYLGKITYARSLAVIAGCYGMKEEFAEAVAYYQQYMENVRDAVREEFRLQNESERLTTWHEEASSIANIFELLIELPEENRTLSGDVAALAYDAALLSKGILLNSSIAFETVLREKGNQHLIDLYNQVRINEAEIERLRREATSDSDLEMILNLTQRNQQLNIELSRGCKELDDFTKYISYNWRDVKAALNHDDVAIEFSKVNMGFGETESHMVALVLTQNAPQPVAVTIWNEETPNSPLLQQEDMLFGTSAAGDMVWGRLSAYLIGKRRVFFSADGLFNRIGIEYLLYEGKPLSEQFEVYRLSSTKELCYRREQAKPSKVVLFGDINYNVEATSSNDTQRSLASLRGSAGNDGFADLGNTLREVRDIQAILQGCGVKNIVMLHDTEASRDAFTSLTDSKVNMLHIATHGMYRDVKTSTDTQAMQNSLLAFAGANLDSLNLVSAADIAAMNLRQCDLAVLSACETGLGKLGGDGVFGLQRGFKNAGVHTLLMSLKNVYDDSTADLMIGFYKYLMDGSTKRDALVKAQQDIRNKGYNDPKYWAAFILLDALDSFNQ